MGGGSWLAMSGFFTSRVPPGFRWGACRRLPRHAAHPSHAAEHAAQQTPNIPSGKWTSTVSHEPKNNLQRDFASITAQIGEPVLLDATQFGACAYRLRNWWTNLIDPALLRAITATVQRPPGLFVHQIPDSNHELTAVRRSNSPPCYSVNMGAELEALPTLMSRVGSYAFVLGEPGSLHIKGTDRYEEPSAEERERALGYATGTTRAPGVTNVQRRVLLGSCMDANCIQSIFAIVAAVYRHKGSPACMVQTNTSEQEVTGLARPPPLMSWLL